MNEKTQARMNETVDRILERLAEGNLPAWCLPVFELLEGIPAARYSFLNRVILAAHDTVDARGYVAWQKAGRQVKQGTHAVWIFAPRFVPSEKENNDTGEKEKVQVLRGFGQIPVFRAEDTDGEPLPYKLPELPGRLPLQEVAEKWGVSVKVDFSGRGEGGSFSWSESRGRRIRVCSPEAVVFLHELAHAAQERVAARRGLALPSGQDPAQEVVAELGAAILANMYGVAWNCERTTSYIEHYGGKARVLAMLVEVGEVVNEIVQAADGTASMTGASGIVAVGRTEE